MVGRGLNTWCVTVMACAVAGTPAPPVGEHTAQISPPDGYVIIEGDILVPLNGPRTAHWDGQAWPEGIVRFHWGSQLNTPELRAPILAAMAELESFSGVQFRSVANPESLEIDRGRNLSPIGPGPQMFLEPQSHHYILVHTLYHLLGFWHEELREDRDEYVTIGNLCCPGAMEIQPAAQIYGPYDFDSVLHSGQYAFSRDGQRTITVRPPNESWQEQIGQRDHLSELDRLTLSFIYPPADAGYRFVDAQSHSVVQDGTFFEPARRFPQGVALTPDGGTLWVQPGHYAGAATYARPMTIRAPLGDVTVGQ